MISLRSFGQSAPMSAIVALAVCMVSPQHLIGQTAAGAPAGGSVSVAGGAAAAEADYETAQRDYAAASADLVTARAAALKQAAASPQTLAAQKEVEAAYQEYTRLKRQTVGSLEKSQPQYQALLNQANAAQAAIDAARDSGTASPEQFAALYSNKAKYTSQMKAIEEQAQDAAGLRDAEQRWRQASRNLESLQTQQKAAVETSPAVVRAKAQVDSARDRLDKSNAQWARSQAELDEKRYQEAREDYQRQVEADLLHHGYGYGYGYRRPYYYYGGWRRY